MPQPHLLALFHRHLEGDDALLRLAGRRLAEARLGAEFYPDSAEQLEQEWPLRPAPAGAYTAHLPRHWDLRTSADRAAVVAFARQFAGRLCGLVVHDHGDWADDLRGAGEALALLGHQLERIEARPMLFIEYAAGLPLEPFTQLFAGVADCPYISACIDVGHVGLFEAERVFSARCPGVDLLRLHPESPHLPELLPELIEAVAAGLPAVLRLLGALSTEGKPLHFHLHDGHPLCTGSRYGVRDHLSFLQPVPIPFEHAGQRTLPLLFGPDGLREIVGAALRSPARDALCFMLEIHPRWEQEPLGRHADLFGHWSDLAQAEVTNHWISVILENHRLLAEACLAG